MATFQRVTAWTCRTSDGPPSTLLLLGSSVTFIPSRLRLSSPVSCSRGGIWTVAPQQQLPPPPGPGPPQPVRTVPRLLTALAASLDRLRRHNALTLHTSWTVQEVIAAEARILESSNYEVGTYTLADWVHLLATRLLPEGGTTAATHTFRDVMASGALRVAAGFARDCPLAWDITPSRLWCCVFSACRGPLGMTQRCYESHSWTLTSCPLLRAW